MKRLIILLLIVGCVTEPRDEINEVKWLYVELKGICYSSSCLLFKLKYTEDSEPTLVHTYDTLIITIYFCRNLVRPMREKNNTGIELLKIICD